MKAVSSFGYDFISWCSASLALNNFFINLIKHMSFSKVLILVLFTLKSLFIFKVGM